MVAAGSTLDFPVSCTERGCGSYDSPQFGTSGSMAHAELWKELKLDTFWRDRLGTSREGTDWEHVLQLLCCYRLLEPGSEWHLHRHWFDRSAMGDLLHEDFSIAAKDTLYRCHDFLLDHKDDLFTFLRGFLEKIQTRFGKARRIWIMDRGIPTEDVPPKCAPSTGSTPAKESMSNSCPAPAHSTCWPVPAPASARNAPCAAAS